MSGLRWLTIAFAALAGAAGAGAQPSAEVLAEGKRVYDYWCLPCHGTGLGLPGFGALPGTQQLALKYRGTAIPPVLHERTDLVPEFVRVIVRQGVSFMPHFRKTEISDIELDALVAYLARNNPPTAAPQR
jgi:mono/diheme cytochrome c family protein